MKNNKVIADKEKMKEFFDTVLNPLKDDEVYVMFSVARKKWDTENSLSRSEEALMRKIIKDNDFDRFYRTLLRFEVPNESLVDRNTNTTIPESVIGYYIDISPKSVIKGSELLMNELLSQLLNTRTNSNDLKGLKGINGKVFSCMARSHSKKYYKILDVDTLDDSVLHTTIDLLKNYEIEIKWVSRTRGGYHIILPLNENTPKFYKSVWPLLNGQFGKLIELTDRATPIVGTYQGGHVVSKVEIEIK